MYHFFVTTQQIIDNQITITGSDVNHIRNVLRLKPGEIILISDDRQMDYRCKLSRLDSGICDCHNPGKGRKQS